MINIVKVIQDNTQTVLEVKISGVYEFVAIPHFATVGDVAKQLRWLATKLEERYDYQMKQIRGDV